MFLPLQSQTKQGNKNSRRRKAEGDTKTERFAQVSLQKIDSRTGKGKRYVL